MTQRILDELAVTAALTNTILSETSIFAFLEELAHYPEGEVIQALKRCRSLKKLGLSDILGHIQDGHPGVEEAWAQMPTDEATSVVWTEPMKNAYGKAYPLIARGDFVGARMAFKEVYVKEVSAARERREPPCWRLSRGHDKEKCELVIEEAIQKGLLAPSERHALPAPKKGGDNMPPPQLREIKALLLKPSPRRRLKKNEQQKEIQRRKEDALLALAKKQYGDL